MLPNDAFLRRLPHALVLRQRLEFDGILTTADLAFLAYDRLSNSLRQIAAQSFENLTPIQNLSLTLDCWSIVSQLHGFSQFCRRLSLIPGGALENYLTKLEVISALRNKIHHLPSNVPNSAGQTGSVHPIFGIVSFFGPQAPDLSWEVHQIALGSMQHREHAFPSLQGAVTPIPGDISHVELTAFGHQVDLSGLMAELEVRINGINDQAEAIVVPAVRAAAVENGEDPDKVLGETAGSMRLLLRMTTAPSM